MMSGSLIGPVAFGTAFAALFSCSVLYLSAESKSRFLSVVVLAYLTWFFIDAFRAWTISNPDNMGWVLLVASASWTVFWHSLELLLVSKANAADMKALAAKHGHFVLRHGGLPSVRLHLYACSLLCNWRRVGTKWQIRDVPRFASDGAVPSRTKYILRALVIIIGCYVVM